MAEAGQKNNLLAQIAVKQPHRAVREACREPQAPPDHSGQAIQDMEIAGMTGF
jgi:hypothetical protein